MKKAINIRAHHLVCIPRFYSGGYNESFTKNIRKVCKYIRKNPEVRLKILVGKLDILCGNCPYKYNNKCRQSKKIGKWVIAQDKKVAKYLKLKPNSVSAARDAFNLVIKKVNDVVIKDICRDCIFLDNCIKVGINKSFKKDINNYSNTRATGIP